MKIYFLLLLICLAQGFKQKTLNLGKSQPHQLSAEDIKLSQAELALYQSDVNVDNTKSHLKNEMTNWVVAKQALSDSLTSLNSWSELFFSKQQQVGVILIIAICFAFYLMVKSEDRHLKLKKQNIKKRESQQPIQILTDSIIQQEQLQQTQIPQLSSIMAQTQIEERVNKSDDYINKSPTLKKEFYRCNSQPSIRTVQRVIQEEYSEEINSLLKDMN